MQAQQPSVPFDAAITSFAPYNWAFISNKYNDVITIRNTGTETWTREKGIKLKWKGSQPNPWGTSNIFELGPTDSIGPGQEKRFSLIITKPNVGSPSRISSCGSYIIGKFNYEWQMSAEYMGFFGTRFIREICV